MKGVDFWWIYMSFLQRQITHWTKSDCYGWMIVMPNKSFVIAILAIGGALVMHLCRTKASERDLDYHLIDECGHKRCLHHRSITVDEKAGALQPIRCTTWRPDPTNLRTRWAIPHLLEVAYTLLLLWRNFHMRILSQWLDPIYISRFSLLSLEKALCKNTECYKTQRKRQVISLCTTELIHLL